MNAILVNESLCLRDGACVAVCPMNMLGRDAAGLPVDLNILNCIVCGQCVAVCPTEAITLREACDEPQLESPKEKPTPAMVDGLLMSRRSVRAYKQKPLGRELLTELLEVAHRAPTATNTQQLHWLVIDGPEKVRALAEETMNALEAKLKPPRTRAYFEAGNEFLLRSAPTVVAITAPKGYRWGA